MASFTLHCKTARDWSGLVFRDEPDRLLALAAGEGVPDIVVQAYDAERDLFYRTSDAIIPDELEEEVRIHFPKPLIERIEGRPFASSVGDSILIQIVEAGVSAISPLTALAHVLEFSGAVNAAILQADNGGLLFVRRAGEKFTAHASAHSLFEFQALDVESRDKVFPDFTATEILLSGSDLDRSNDFEDDPLIVARRIRIEDFKGLVDFSEDAANVVSAQPHLYTLAIGAAAVYSEIRRAIMESA
jgi:hypothetical protein